MQRDLSCGGFLPQPVHEPVSTAIGLTALISSTVGGTVLGVSAGAIGGAIISAGASFALGAASLALQDNERSTQIKGAEGQQAIEKGLREPGFRPAPPQRLVLGTVTTSGDVVFQRDDPPHIWRTFVLAAHECGDFLQLIVNGQTVSLADGATAGTLVPTSPPFFDGTSEFIEIAYRSGAANQAMCPILARDFPGLPATFRQRGCATVTIKAHYGASEAAHGQIWGTENRFNPLFRFQGAKHFDPRVPGCALSDPATWVNGSAASLNIMRALTHQWPRMRLLDPVREVDWDKVSEGADTDDRLVGVKGDGNIITLERNHTCDGVILAPEAGEATTLRNLLTSCDGYLVSRAGKYHVMPGTEREPEGTLTQDMLRDGFDFQSETPDRDLINTVKTEFIAPDRDYKPVPGPVVSRQDYVLRNGQDLETDLALPFTEGPNGAARPQRLARRKLLDSQGPQGNGQRSFSATFDLRAKRYKAGMVVRLWFEHFPRVNGVYLVTRASRGGSLSEIVLEMVSWDNARFAWNPANGDQRPFDIDATLPEVEAA